MNELKRQYLAANKRVPDIAKYEQEIMELENQLMIERSETDKLSNQLEDPANTNRWRPLDGDDSTIEQLISKINLLEERLDLKREQLLEKDLILEEVTTLTERLKNQALKKKDSSKSMADELNSLQTRIRDVTKKMLASVSELSMYQVCVLSSSLP
jgi:flagellar biosynthesis chaperone FliJ